MTAIVTGATGFIGSRLVETLTRAAEEVRCFVRRPRPPAAGLERDTIVDYNRAGLGVGDEVFHGVDTVYHLAGATRAATDAAYLEANLTATERLMDRITAAGATPRFVLVSSQAAAGPASSPDRPVTEDQRPAPVEAYGRSKLAAEQAVIARKGDLPGTIIRPSAVYGPRDRDFLSIFKMARLGLSVYPASREALIDTIYVDDLVAGIIAAAKSPVSEGRTYFMAQSPPSSWKTVVQTIASVAGVKATREISIPREIISAGGAIGDVVGRLTGMTPLINGSKATLSAQQFWICSSSRAANEFGFVARTSLHAGVTATYAWYRQHQWL